MRTLVLPAVLAIVIGAPAAALAQGDQSQPASSSDTSLDTHERLSIGVAVGGGSVWSSGCKGCDLPHGQLISASLGWFVNPRLAVMCDVVAFTSADALNLLATSNDLASLAVQYWATPRVWLKGGVGRAKLIAATPFGTGNVGGGGMTLGAGAEVLQRGSFALDVQGRFTTSQIQQVTFTNLGVLVGFNWY